MKQIIQKQKVIFLEKKDYLESEKNDFLAVLNEFFDSLEEKRTNLIGRPQIYFKDMLKSLLIMAYHGFSYRRCRSDLEIARQFGIINAIPKRSTLCKYMNQEETKKQVIELIQQSALLFIPSESHLILDSTWFGLKMYSGGHNRKPFSSHDKENAPLTKTRKLHIGILKNSRIIAYATTSKGTMHDSVLFKEIVSKVLDNGFSIHVLLADSGYLSKSNYTFAQEKGIENIFIDFRKNITGKRAKSQAWRDAFYLWKKDKEYWHEIYRYRVIIEGFFSLLKRKFMNWLRNRKAISRDNEMLLKVLAYNLTILVKYIKN